MSSEQGQGNNKQMFVVNKANLFAKNMHDIIYVEVTLAVEVTPFYGN